MQAHTIFAIGVALSTQFVTGCGSGSPRMPDPSDTQSALPNYPAKGWMLLQSPQATGLEPGTILAMVKGELWPAGHIDVTITPSTPIEHPDFRHAKQTGGGASLDVPFLAKFFGLTVRSGFDGQSGYLLNIQLRGATRAQAIIDDKLDSSLSALHDAQKPFANESITPEALFLVLGTDRSESITFQVLEGSGSQAEGTLEIEEVFELGGQAWAAGQTGSNLTRTFDQPYIVAIRPVTIQSPGNLAGQTEWTVTEPTQEQLKALSHAPLKLE